MPKIEICAPLVGFDWTGTELTMGDTTSIRPGTCFDGYDAKDVSEFISPEEKDRCRETRHWLFFTRVAHSPVSAAVNINAFLLSLWIVRPTPTHVTVRFEKSPDGEYHAVRVLDRFQWVRGHVWEDVCEEHLLEVSDLFPHVLEAYANGGRHRTALVLAFRGCVSKDWQAATLCFAAALATLFRHSDTKRVLDQLVSGFSKLQSLSKAARSISPETVAVLYKAAAEILEGHSTPRDDADKNLADLARLSEILRIALHASLMSEKIGDPA